MAWATPWQNPPRAPWATPWQEPPRSDSPLEALLATLAQGPATGGGLPVVRPQGPAPTFDIGSLIAGLMQNKGASQAAAAQPMPMGLPAPRPMATPIPGGTPGPALLDKNIATVREATQAKPMGIGEIISAIAQPSAAAPPPLSGQPGPGTIKWGLPQPSTPAGPRSMVIGAPAAAPVDPKIAAMSLIRAKEGFRETPYMDVNALRGGYGTDTITLADGTVKPVTAATRFTKEDAERDLSRRTDEFMQGVQSKVGDKFATLNPQQVAALTSIAYNYGELPDSVAAAVKSGDAEAAAKAIEGLKGHNKGVNAARRQEEANLFRGQASDGNAFAMPGVPELSTTQLPIPGATTPRQGLDPAAFDKFDALSVSAPPPANPVDRMANILSAMAAGAANAKDLGSLLAGAGAGAGRAAAENVSTRRAEMRELGGREDALKRMLAEVGVRRAEAETQGQNFKIDAQNQDKQLLHQVQTAQAQLDTGTKNKLAELQNEVDWKKWQLFQPQVIPSKDGVAVITRTPDGKIKFESQRGNDMDLMAERVTDAAKIYGKDSAVVDTMRYSALAKAGEPYVRRQIMKDMVDNNLVLDVLGPDQAKALEKEAEKRVDAKLLGKPEEFDKQKKQAMLDLLWTQLDKSKDGVWLPKMLQKGNVGAALLVQPQ